MYTIPVYSVLKNAQEAWYYYITNGNKELAITVSEIEAITLRAAYSWKPRNENLP